MTKLIAANWKMHGSRTSARELAQAVSRHPAGAEVLLCPPAVYLREVGDVLKETGVFLGGQDCHASPEGAFTGDISAPMLKDAGCSHVILGHSERREYHAETSETVRAKARAALQSGLIPLVCVGETKEIREQGQAEAFVTAQAHASLPEGVSNEDFVLAYEPVWAIGTGLTATLDDIRAMHGRLHALFPGTRVLYGGSVKAANAKEILGLPGVDGALVGSASLKAEEFCAIIDAAAGE